MNDSKTQLKAQHKFLDCLYWNLFGALPFIIACIGIYKSSIIWLILYVIVFLCLIVIIYRFYCAHCPHYIQGAKTTKCMFFWGIPKFFKSNTNPPNFFEKAVSLIAALIIILLPLYWLRLQVDLLVIYLLSFAVFGITIKRYECSRCIYFNCPANNVPEDIKGAKL